MNFAKHLSKFAVAGAAVAGLALAVPAMAGTFTLVPSTITGCGACTSPVSNVYGMTFLGTSYIQNDLSGGANPAALDAGDTFTEYGGLTSTGLLSADSTPILPGTSGVNVNWQIGALFNGLAGVNTSVTSGLAKFSFTPGAGQIDIYATPFGTPQSPNDPSTIDSASATLVASLEVLKGTGSFDFGATTPDGAIDILAEFTSLPVAGFWQQNGLDINLGSTIFLAITDSNNNFIQADGATQTAFDNYWGITTANNPSGQLFTSNDGSVKFTIPDPGSLLLVGTGLLLLGFSFRRRQTS